jgi:ABC-type uncharacterized transport system substrate-binding protein
MKRREFIALVGAGVAGWPLATRAQRSDRVRRIAVLMNLTEDSPAGQDGIAAFRQRMLQLGWFENHNLRIDTFWDTSDDIKMNEKAVEAVAVGPDVIVAMGATLRPLLQASGAVPIVFVDAPDPVGAGYVKTLARPGGNVTGILAFEYGIAKKWTELLRQIAPSVKQVTTIHDPTVSAEVLFGIIPSQQSRTQLSAANLRDPSELERALTALAATPNSGVIIASEAAVKYRGRIVALVNSHKLPAIYFQEIFVADGGLISYGPDFADLFRLAAGYTVRILKGEKPADLPVQPPSKYNLVINVKTARAFGLMVPHSMLTRAQEVIE